MKNFKSGFLIFCAALFVLAACRKDEEPIEGKVDQKITLNAITGVSGPTGGKVNQELKFDVLWHSADSTLRFHHLVDSVSDNTRIIKLYVKNLPADSLKLDTLTSSVPYKFKAPAAGVYFLKFWKDPTGKSPIVDTIIIR